ncbi:unnamed protein product [Clonostachys rosea]|uniref:Xaa-Pro dipeptidyl-peptidase C-terminal domain-containing protein n=1 Tax=Bionectria ochroleuca TaxID=29856 RepID=A0ABY6UKJ4_BIOOC|nr:unnamed protein product [Clonostachys rosea]
MSALQNFTGVIWRNLVPPEQHPGFNYEGFHPNLSVPLNRGHQLNSSYCAFRNDTILDFDVQVSMRDGVSIFTNVYRPASSEAPKMPALIAWSPYGKGGGGSGPQNYDSMGPFRMNIDYQSLSGYETFEGPNPAEWVERGYVVVDPDARGAMHSEGDIAFSGEQEALDVYDLIEWTTQQSWSDGNAVMFGNSWLAIAQINHAARSPHPALKAIAPWEAMNDLYRETIAKGGISNPEDAFGELIMGGFAGYFKTEDPYSTLTNRPLYDDYWESKHIDVQRINIPTYLTASYSSRLHSLGSFNSFDKIQSKNKWVRVHATQEWNDLYKQQNMDDLQRFYDYFAKGITDNGWDQTPPMRLTLLAMDGSVAKPVIERPELDRGYPLKRTEMIKYNLDAASMSLTLEPVATLANASYEAHNLTGQIDFNLTFDRYTEVSGLPWIKLFMSCKEKDDMDVHVILRKRNVEGELLSYANYRMPAPIDKVPNVNVAKFQGPDGSLRASHRVSQVEKVDPLEVPAYTHMMRESIPNGTVVGLEIPIWPIGMVFEAGEGLAVVVAGHDLRLPEVGEAKLLDGNVGQHVVHTGGEFESFLMLPVIN